MTATHTPRLVSVVISCYNHARFIGETVESALAQTYPHVEVIVVDDGSQDRTSEVVARYGGVRYIQQRNQGVARARNNGLRATAGAFVTFLDGDDRLLPEAVSTGVRELDSHPDSMFVYGRCRLIDADGASLPTDANPLVERDHYLELLRGNYIWMPAQVMFRRGALEEVGGFDPAADHAGDYDLYLKLSRRHAVHDHLQIVAEWRQHSTNTSRNSFLMLRSALKVLRAQRPFLRKTQEYREAYRYGIGFYQMIYGDPIVEQVRADLHTPGRRRQAVSSAWWLLRYCPQIVRVQLYRKLRNSRPLRRE